VTEKLAASSKTVRINQIIRKEFERIEDEDWK
jgi:hypothetical protein